MKNEIEKMKNDAKNMLKKIRRKKKLLKLRNQADSLVFQTKKQIEELKDKVPADVKSRLETEIKKVEDALASNNTEQIKTATESLNKVWNEVASQLYSQAGPEGQTASEPQPDANPKTSEGKDDVQDASYEVVDDDKK